MSYDRVLPKPAALHYEAPQATLPRQTSNLLEHKIMNDHVASKFAIMDRRQMNGESVGDSSSCRFVNDLRMNGVSHAHAPSLNRAKTVLNKIASSSPFQTSKPVAAPLITKDIPIRERSAHGSERSSSSSPVKSAVSKEPVTQFCLCQPDPKIPRPRNAFILYRQHYQAAVVAQNPGLANPEISKIIGEQWRKLPLETKDEWKALAEEEKARHQQQYPEYRYQPRRLGRDGNPRSATGSGISHNPSGSSVCGRCGGRIMNPPLSPETPFTPSMSSNFSSAPAHIETITVRSHHSRARDPDRPINPIKIASNGDPSRLARQRHWEENVNGNRSPDPKRRRINSQTAYKPNINRDRSPPESPYPMSPYPPRSDGTNSRGMVHALQPSRPFRGVKEHSPHDPSLKLPPLQTTTSVPMTPVTPFVTDGSNLEATVMTIPFLNKIKLLAKISPPLTPSLRDASQHRGAVIAVDGQDAAQAKNTVDFLYNALQKEGKYTVRVFEGPEVQPRKASSDSGGQMGDATVDYLNTISEWHRISDEIISFVRPSSPSPHLKSAEEGTSAGVSPRTLVPKTAELQIDSPPQSLDNGSESAASPAAGTSSDSSIPIALIPRYQLTTANSFACSIPINDSYTPLDHWQWMASLWRACVGPDITVYIRECEKDELDRLGGNPVEVRLHDARTVVIRRTIGSSKDLEEKALKRVGFEIEDFLTQ